MPRDKAVTRAAKPAPKREAAKPQRTEAQRKAFWDHVERTSALVKQWPEWAGGDPKKPGDVTICPSCSQPLPKEKL